MANLFENDGLSEITPKIFCDVLLPLPLATFFTYEIPNHLISDVKQFFRVVVPFRTQYFTTGIVVRVHAEAPTKYKAKEILDILDDSPIITPLQFELINWISSYYMCTLGEVLNALLPSGLKLSSESFLQINPEYQPDFSQLKDREIQLIELLESRPYVSYLELPKLLGIRNYAPLIKSLTEKGAVLLFQSLKEQYKPRYEKYIALNTDIAEDESLLKSTFDRLEKFPLQTEVLMRLMQFNYQNQNQGKKGILKSKLIETGISASALKTLLKNQILVESSLKVSRFGQFRFDDSIKFPELSPIQLLAKQNIEEHFAIKNQVLIHGITGSGKTEIYIHLIQSYLQKGQQVLYLLPEIALTTQIVERLKRFFGDQMGIYHSKFSDNERVEIYRNLLEKKYNLILGVRSSVFLPFDQLGLVIIDEEHDPSYKQNDPAPRYNGRDTAIMLAKNHQAKVLAGSATPSLELYSLAKSGEWGLVNLSQRYNGENPPEISWIDTQKEKKQRRMREEFSATLIQEIQQTLDKKEQVLLFYNRRGYAYWLMCANCHWIPVCINCSVSLTYHQLKHELRCSLLWV